MNWLHVTSMVLFPPPSSRFLYGFEFPGGIIPLVGPLVDKQL